MRAWLSKLSCCNCFEKKKQDRVNMGKRARAQAVDEERRSSGMNPLSRDSPAQKALDKDAPLKYETLPANQKSRVSLALLQEQERLVLDEGVPHNRRQHARDQGNFHQRCVQR